VLVLGKIEILPTLGKYKYNTWRILLVMCYFDNFVCLRSCIRNVNTHISQGERQRTLPEGDRMLAWDYSVKWVWAAFELVPDQPYPFEGVEVHEDEATAPIHEGFSELGHFDLRVDYEGKSPWLLDTIRVIHPIKSDRGLGQSTVLWGSHTHNIDCPTHKFELMPGLVGDGSSFFEGMDTVAFPLGSPSGFWPLVRAPVVM
jgi:hypothetical protein